MSFEPYLHFQGNCAEAMRFYAEVFGGEVQMMRYSDAPDLPPEMATSERVMHASLYVGGRSLMASDFPPGTEGDAQAAVSVYHGVADVDHARAIFWRLAEGGTVIMPFAPTFWSAGFGMVKDRFGTHWMVSGPEAAA